jgi:ethanolamine utilization protein EutN
MQLARVVGSVVATVKDPALASRKLLLIQPIAPSGDPAGAPLVALDGIGVGPGEEIMFVKGREAAFAFLPDLVLADAAIVGKVDSVSHAQVSGARPPSRSFGGPRRSPEGGGGRATKK